MRRFGLTLILFIAVFAMQGCAHSAFKSSLRTYTEHGRIYNFEHFEARLIWHATFFSDNFRRAFEKKHIELHHFGPMESAKFIAEQEYKQEDSWNFFIGMYTKREYKQFTNYDDSFWKIELITENGDVVKAESIENVPLDPYVLEIYPYLNRWSRTYMVSFPKVDLGKKFQLVLKGVAGTSVLKWKIK